MKGKTEMTILSLFQLCFKQWFRSLWKHQKISTKAQEWLYVVVTEKEER